MSFNPALSYSQGLQMGQQNKISALKNALSGQAQEQGFNPSESAEFRQLNALDPNSAQGIYKTYQALGKDRQKAIYQDASKALDMLKSGDVDGFKALTRDRIANVLRLGGDPSGAMSVLQRVDGGDVDGAMQQLGNTVQTGIQEGFLADPLDRELKELQVESLQTKPREQTPLEKAQEKADFERRKEERQVAKDSVIGFNKRASEIRSSYKKVESILSSGKLNRMKIASAMTSMARLLSPGIVTNQDFQNLSNSANPVAELLSKLTGKGEQGANVAENLQRFYDPTNPDLFDKDSFLSTARNVAGAEIPALIDTFNDARDRAGRAGISEKSLDTNFGQNKNFEYLTGMLEQSKPVLNHPKLGNVTEGQIQETMKNKGMTREQVLALLENN